MTKKNLGENDTHFGTLFDEHPQAPPKALLRLKEASRLFSEMRHLYRSTEGIRNRNGALIPSEIIKKPLS
jgi:hypothetical protein